MRFRRSLLIAVLLLQVTLVAAQDLQSKLDEYLNAAVKVNHFSGSVLVTKDGKVVLSKGYGMANYELGVPNTPQTKFRLGSITKQFTATAILQLQEKGLLNVNDPVRKYYPGAPDAWSKITIHHLLIHTSGIPNFTSFPDYLKTMMLPSPPEKTIEKFKDKPLDFAPGEKYKYSNSGYVLLGYIVEKVSGKPYEKYLAENILEPLHMADTGYDHTDVLLKNRAEGYEARDDGFRNAAYIDMTIPGGAGGLYSTVEDLYLWEQGLLAGKVLKKESLDQMLKGWIAVNANAQYGYGLNISTVAGHRNLAHAGGINGFVSFISMFPDDHMFFVFLSNSEKPGPITRGLNAILFNQPYDLPATPAAVGQAAAAGNACQVPADGKMSFDVASIHVSKGPFTSPSFPLDTSDAYGPTGGRFKADFPLMTYIGFAYKIWFTEDERRSMLARLPKWASSERFSIEARVECNPTKDQMRVMMKSLLAERFQFKAHFETQEENVFELALVKQRKTGTKLRLHSEGPPCDSPPDNDVFPPVCDVYAATRSREGPTRLGSRNTTMPLLADSLSSAAGRRVLDKTGIVERVDFVLEWSAETQAVPPADPATPAASEPQGSTFLQALRDQLGLKLEPTKGPIQVLVIDHVETPTEN